MELWTVSTMAVEKMLVAPSFVNINPNPCRPFLVMYPQCKHSIIFSGASRTSSLLLSTQQKLAGQILTQFKESQEVWTQVDSVLELSSNLNTKYFALQVLEILIRTRWKALPREQCEGAVCSHGVCLGEVPTPCFHL